MSVYSISYRASSDSDIKAVIDEVLNGTQAVRLNEECWLLDTILSENEVIETLKFIVETTEPFVAITQMRFGDWLQKSYAIDVFYWLTDPLRNW